MYFKMPRMSNTMPAKGRLEALGLDIGLKQVKKPVEKVLNGVLPKDQLQSATIHFY
jgi:hypothetical protein